MANPIRKTSRRTKRRSAPRAAKTVYRYRTRGRGRKMARRAGAFAKSTFLGLNVTGAIKNALPLLFGALVGKAAAKKLADSGGEGENWTWKNYALCMGGGAAGALLIEAVFKRRGLGQKVLEGATLLTLFKIWTNEIAPKNATLQAWFGGADEDFGQADPYAGLMAQADPYAGLFGAVTEEPEGDYSQDEMAYYGTPVLPSGGRMGADIRDAGGRMGGLGAEESRAVTEMFNRAYR